MLNGDLKKINDTLESYMDIMELFKEFIEELEKKVMKIISTQDYGF